MQIAFSFCRVKRNGYFYFMKKYSLTAVPVLLPFILLISGCSIPVLPELETAAVSQTGTTSLTCGGTVLTDGGAPVLARGVCWSTATGPSVDLPTKTNNGSGTGSFTSSVTGLAPNTTYYIRAYASNEAGTAYGNQITATTLPANASLTTSQASQITSFGAISGGNIADDGGSAVTLRGVCWSTATGPTADLPSRTQDGTGKGAFVSTLTGLSSRTTYYIRAYATNAAGTAYGQQIMVETPASVSLSATTLTVLAAESQNNDIVINSYGPWTAQVTGNTPWITLISITGEAGSSTFFFAMAENDTRADRTGIIRITCQDMSADITVNQLRAGGYMDDGDLF